MPHRPLVFVLGLTVGDYLLWNWSLNGSHAALALASGLTLPPLAVACAWLLVLALARLVAALTRRPGASRARGFAAGRRARAGAAGLRGRSAAVGARTASVDARAAAVDGGALGEPAPSPTRPGRRSGKLAA